MRRIHRATIAVVACTTLACEREDRRLNEPPPKPPVTFVAQVPLQPGPTLVTDTAEGPFDDNAFGTAEGQQLFKQMNCSGCHSNGGGGMGPPLMDDEWIYGSDPENIVATIVEGRPNGMPAFRGRIPNQQLWQVAAYVRSLAGLTPKAPSPGRDDDMQYKVDEQRTPAQPQRSAESRGIPPKSQQP